MPELKVTVATLAAAGASIVLALVRHQAVDEATVQTVVLTVATFVTAWLAPHTPRASS